MGQGRQPYLPQVAPGSAFVNADLIAAGLSPLAPEQQRITASRLFLHQIEGHIAQRLAFAFETTLFFTKESSINS